MKRKSGSTRLTSTGGFANSASAMIALVAVAALMASMPSLAHMRPSAVEARSTILEGQSVRAVAEAVAAAARELVSSDRVVPASDMTSFAIGSSDQTTVGFRPPLESRDVHELVRSRVISERMLDLPPPVC